MQAVPVTGFQSQPERLGQIEGGLLGWGQRERAGGVALGAGFMDLLDVCLQQYQQGMARCYGQGVAVEQVELLQQQGLLLPHRVMGVVGQPCPAAVRLREPGGLFGRPVRQFHSGQCEGHRLGANGMNGA